MTKNLSELSLVDLSELLLSTNNQFVEALQSDGPIEQLEHLRNYLKEIRVEIKRREGKREKDETLRKKR